MDRAQTTSYALDDRNIQWNAIEVPGCGVLPGFGFVLLAGSLALQVVDFLIEFPPKQEVNGRVVNLIPAHRHCGITNLFVIAGEHHIYEPDGTLREVRPVGSHTVFLPRDVHTEGSGDFTWTSHLDLLYAPPLRHVTSCCINRFH